MKAWFRAFVRKHIIDEVPDELDACLSCGRTQCLTGEYVYCLKRLDRAAQLKAARTPLPQFQSASFGEHPAMVAWQFDPQSASPAAASMPCAESAQH